MECVLRRLGSIEGQSESVFRLHNVNIVDFYYLFNCATCFAHTTIFLGKYVCLKMVV
jgi:hypothetical protein